MLSGFSGGCSGQLVWGITGVLLWCLPIGPVASVLGVFRSAVQAAGLHVLQPRIIRFAASRPPASRAAPSLGRSAACIL